MAPGPLTHDVTLGEAPQVCGGWPQSRHPVCSQFRHTSHTDSGFDTRWFSLNQQARMSKCDKHGDLQHACTFVWLALFLNSVPAM